MDIDFDYSLEYERHQRDYSILGTTIVFRGLFKQNARFFGVIPNPVYFLVKDDILYHYMAKKDGVSRMKNWLKKNDLNSFKKIEKFYSARLKEFNKFILKQPENLELAIKQAEEFFVDFTEIILLGYELPLYMKDKASSEIIDFALASREKYENVHKINFSIIEKLLNQLEKNRDIPKDTLKYLTIEELEDFLRNNKLADIGYRKKYIVVKYDGNYSFFYDPNLWNILNPKVARDFVKGNTAYKGIVRGTVKIIKKITEAAELKKGQILITSMTDPRYVPAMKKAAAIVTDEGGITCHAAIVSRELKIPCVIGTKEATQVFKDGDMVEVDANQGIVRKIK